VDLARSVLYQACSPDRWTLDFYARSRVGRAAFGTDRIPDGWSDRCNAMDEVWVPTEFNRETFVASGVDSHRLRVVRTGIDTRLFRPDVPPLEIPHLRGFNFLSLSDWRAQQGTDVLLRAYVHEFKPDEDVALILKISECENSSVDVEAELLSFIEINLKRGLENIPRVILLSGGSAYPQDDFARLCASAHAFVCPCRAEALGRALLEALSGGLPVIATRWGAPLEFLDDDNSFLIGMEGLVPALPEEEHLAGHRWAEPSVDHLRELMREVFSNGEEAGKRAKQGRKDAVERWDWSVVIAQWTDAFGRLLA
jgi:glycosyltransferase involved in cell wall biosynthesis